MAQIPRPSGLYFIRIVCLFTRTGRSYRPKLSVQLPTLSANLPLFTWRLDFQSTVRNLCASQPPVVSPRASSPPTTGGSFLVRAAPLANLVRAAFICEARACMHAWLTLHLDQPSEEAPDAQRHPIHDPNRRCDGGDLGSEVTGTSTVPAMYQGRGCVPTSQASYNACFNLALARGESAAWGERKSLNWFIYQCLEGKIPFDEPRRARPGRAG
jgi:hypothetical protein